MASAGTALSVALAEAAHWWASRRYLAHPPPLDGPGASSIIVLGYPPRRDGSIHPVARWRVKMALRALGRLGADTVVFSGGTREGRPSEASVMAATALSLGLPPAALRTEENASSTWENVALSLPLVAGCSRLAFISDPMHAARARKYAVQQQPELAAKLVSGGEYALFERWWLKFPTALHEAYKLVAERKD